MIRVENLHVKLKGRAILSDINFTLRAGEVVGLFGPPAAGKSILFKAVAALVEPEQGAIYVDDARIDNAPFAQKVAWRRRIGMAFQNDALFDDMTVFDNIAFPLRRRQVDEALIAERVMGRLTDVELAGAAQKFPSEISGGMRKRVGIARATVIEPDVGLFDDPIAGLDPVTSGVILDLIVRLQTRLNMAVVIVSNDLPVLLPICTRAMMLHQGRVVYDAPPQGLAGAEQSAVRQFIQGADEGPL